MIRVAICDDEHETLHYLADKVAHYAEQKKLNITIDTFCHAEDLEAQITCMEAYQIYILDMLMPQKNGIELGQIIRRKDRQATMIYLTSSTDYAYQAFGVFAQRYLLKPLKEQEFYEAMDFAVENALQMQKTLNVNTAHGLQRILYHEIEYVENSARALHIFATDGKEVVSRLLRKSFENDMRSLLESRDFIQIHKSFIVNLSHVRQYEPNLMTMRSGAEIPISKSRQADVKRNYLKYISEGF